MKIGILREGKIPHDDRVALTPAQCKLLSGNPHNFEITVQPSPLRSYSDEEYIAAHIPVLEDISHCDIILGVKEVPIKDLMEGKTYFFFSHTIKKQAHNRKLLRAILDKNITLIDYETIEDIQGKRLIAFGKYAGIVGAHNGVWTYGKRKGLFDWPRLKDLHDYEQARKVYANTILPPMRIVVTGSGRVAGGAISALTEMNIKEIPVEEYLLNKEYNHPVFVRLTSKDYVRHKAGHPFEKSDFYEYPQNYESAFSPFLAITDIFLNCIFWDISAPAFFKLEDLSQDSFHISVIADVTCDIAPASSIPTTIKASTIDNPVFGISRTDYKETAAFQPESIDIMSIDNLPNELPRDASRYFGDTFVRVIVPELEAENSDILDRATIAKNGKLTPHFKYLEDYVNGNVFSEK